MIIENRALCLARSFALSRYNHPAVIIISKASSFQNGSQIFDVSESEIDQYFYFQGDYWVFADIHVAWGD